MTVGAYFDRWLQRHPRSPSTDAHLRLMVRSFAVEHEGRELARLSRSACQRWAREHPSRARYIHAFLEDARRDALLAANPMSGLVPAARSREVKPPSEREVLSAAARALETFGEWGPVFRSAILFSAYSGLRVSEMAAVQAADVEQSGVHLPGLVTARAVSVRVREGKGGKGRLVGVYGPGRQALVEVLPEVGLVFRNSEGGRLSRSTVGKAWRRVRPPAVRWHDLRHFCATWLLDRGAKGEDVAYQLFGHPNPRLVYDVYGHPNRDLALDRLREVADG